MIARFPLPLFSGVFAVLMLAACTGRSDDDFLPPEAAFKLSARAVDAHTVELSFTIAPGYYLYRDPFRFEAADAQLDTPVIPRGEPKFDATFRKTLEVHRDLVRISVPVRQGTPKIRLAVTSQGCADKGLCYPPMRSEVAVSLVGLGGGGSAAVLDSAAQSRGGAVW